MNLCSRNKDMNPYSQIIFAYVIIADLLEQNWNPSLSRIVRISSKLSAIFFSSKKKGKYIRINHQHARLLCTYTPLKKKKDKRICLPSIP